MNQFVQLVFFLQNHFDTPEQISATHRNSPNKTKVIMAMTPMIPDILRSSWAELSFLIKEESCVLFRVNFFLLIFTDSSTVWFVFLHTQKHSVLLTIIFCVVPSVVRTVEGFSSVVEGMFVVVVGKVVDSVKVVVWIIMVDCGVVVVVWTSVVGEHEGALNGVFLLAK